VQRASFSRFHEIQPQWNHLDAFGHVNNAEFYAYFDTAIVTLLIEIGALDVRVGDLAALVVESGARYHREVLFGDVLAVGIAIAHLGTSSIRYRLGVFRNIEAEAAVDGHFVHVVVGRTDHRPIPIPPEVRVALEALRA
jgi:acyl-CoA thioester hydrolase